MNPHLLIVEDEPSLRMGLADGLASEGFTVEECADGASALERAQAGGLDAMLLDLMLPGMDGLQVLRRLREAGNDLPIVILSARGEESDRILGFEYGADDYVVKPAPLRELALRLRAVLRRGDPSGPRSARFGEVEVDFAANRLELELLRYLLANPDTPIERNQLLREVWGQDRPAQTRTVDTHVFRLRQKIEADPERPQHLLTVRGVGYRFVTDL
jgi:DNA-binding response OmpR family regulator